MYSYTELYGMIFLPRQFVCPGEDHSLFSVGHSSFFASQTSRAAKGLISANNVTLFILMERDKIGPGGFACTTRGLLLLTHFGKTPEAENLFPMIF